MNFKKSIPAILIIYTGLLIIASILPAFGALNKKKIELIFELRFDYILHFMAYLGLYILLVISKKTSKKSVSKLSSLKLVFLAVLLALATETAQLFIPYRTFNPVDLAANLLGILAGVVVYYFFNKKILQEEA